uniref:BZIP domain-containing protein n=1 Tax=Compsopogon caeruleus TaxID=31354 RepID=A0A7S1XEJ3_9RHOD|mmetsp:Transcript_3704/g.7094  ORF Transcript_3704/g.7094 Transcript_3704/m.7094 type:complete len:339 (+) Transcript_3704:2-1018(+)
MDGVVEEWRRSAGVEIWVDHATVEEGNAVGHEEPQRGDTERTQEHEGESAVDRAKRRAEEFAIAQVEEQKAKKLRAGASNGGSSSPIEEEKLVEGDSDEPQDLSQKRYQRRLAKNRNSAFVSRIRRRAYTGFLEESLEEEERQRMKLERELEKMKAELRNLRGDGSVITVLEHPNTKQTGHMRLRNAFHDMRSSFAPIVASPMTPIGVSTMFVFVFLVGLLIPGLTLHKSSDIVAVPRSTVADGSRTGARYVQTPQSGKIWGDVPSILTTTSTNTSVNGWTPWIKSSVEDAVSTNGDSNRKRIRGKVRVETRQICELFPVHDVDLCDENGSVVVESGS